MNKALVPGYKYIADRSSNLHAFWTLLLHGKIKVPVEDIVDLYLEYKKWPKLIWTREDK